MPLEVSDKISNLNDHLANAAKAIGRSRDRKKLFEAIYWGKRKTKTKKELARATDLEEIRILQEGKTLANNHLVTPLKVNGAMAYEKISFYTQYKKKILSLVDRPERIKQLPTRVNPGGGKQLLQVNVKFPNKTFDVVQLMVEDIENFSAVRRVQEGHRTQPLAEQRFKMGIQKILAEKGKFTDWGGEKNDLYTTRVRIRGYRLACAFAFKGKGLRGILKPNRMGKNGDQISRLFQSEARVFIVQYWDQIDQSVYELMKSLAVARSAIYRERVYYCIINGTDTDRLCKAYPAAF